MMDAVEKAWDNKRFVRWMCSQWCQYSCSYCSQVHSRKQVYKGSPGHCFDNASPAQWLDAFNTRFGDRRASVHITGGEPFLDRKNMSRFLAGLCAEGYVEYVSIDTNGGNTWRCPSSKVELMVSYHREHVAELEYIRNVDALISDGWAVSSGAVILMPGKLDEFLRIERALASLGVLTWAMALDWTYDGYSEEEAKLLRTQNPSWVGRQFAGESPIGKMCLYPSLTYDVDPDGSVVLACYREDPANHGNIFSGAPLPQLKGGYTPCPRASCVCEEKFSFLADIGVNVDAGPKRTYSRILKELKG